MPLSEKTAIRAALRLHDCLKQHSTQIPELSLSCTYWNQCHQYVQSLQKARARNWISAAAYRQSELENVLIYLRNEVDRLARAVSSSNDDFALLLTPGQIHAELRALENEFDEVECDLKQQTLTVTTDPIELDGIELGSFRIRFYWNRLNDTSCYHVIAVDPRHPESRPDVTHPHVQNDILCEGEATEAIQKALFSGRLSDFFLIVAQTLETYNSGSAYVQLNRWSDSACSCADCDCDLDDDSSFFCDRCYSTVCNECTQSCDKCGTYTCFSCHANCQECDNGFCRNCLQTCDKCFHHFCEGCLQDGRCPSCRTENKPTDSETASSATETADETNADAPVHTDSVGQTLVPP